MHFLKIINCKPLNFQATMENSLKNLKIAKKLQKTRFFKKTRF